MRPRRIAAENPAATPTWIRTCASFNEAAANRRGKLTCAPAATPTWIRFNEAAANRRGKLEAIKRFLGDGWASMRPRRIAAENAMTGVDHRDKFPLQ